MLERLEPQSPDALLALIKLHAADERTDKIDLGVGVYKNAEGLTPIMRAVKEAERRWWEVEDTKAYTALAGDPAFADAMVALVLGDTVPRAAVAAVATPGGTGAVRQAFELINMIREAIRKRKAVGDTLGDQNYTVESKAGGARQETKPRRKINYLEDDAKFGIIAVLDA